MSLQREEASVAVRIEEAARALGFRRLGLVPIGDRRLGSAQTHAYYLWWLEQGYAGEMHYLHRHAPLKVHPRFVAAKAQTLLVLS